MSEQNVIDWLLDGDPSVRWQVMRDLTDESATAVRAERARVATHGHGAQLLALQAQDGRWGGAAWNRGWDSTMHVLWLLREMGLDPDSGEANVALARVRANVTWRGCGPPEAEGNSFFAGETEPCINGQVAAAGAYFRQDVRSLVSRLLGPPVPDRGGASEAGPGSTRESLHTTNIGVEALLEYEHANGVDDKVNDARRRGEEYLLDRRLLRRKSTGERLDLDRKGRVPLTDLAFPCWWHYDALRALDYLRRCGVQPDARIGEAIELLQAKRGHDGRWRLERQHPGRMPVEIDEREGTPSRWITLRAMRVLRWAGA